VKATENSKMPAETMDRLSWVQKLNQPMRLHATAALLSAFLAASLMAGVSSRGSGTDTAVFGCRPRLFHTLSVIT
jgi:hypothetical protein